MPESEYMRAIVKMPKSKRKVILPLLQGYQKRLGKPTIGGNILYEEVNDGEMVLKLMPIGRALGDEEFNHINMFTLRPVKIKEAQVSLPTST